MKILNCKNKSFDHQLDQLLSIRKSKVQSSSISVVNIIKDVRKNGDKALLKYEKRFNKNSTIDPTKKQILKLIKSCVQKIESTQRRKIHSRQMNWSKV